MPLCLAALVISAAQAPPRRPQRRPRRPPAQKPVPPPPPAADLVIVNSRVFTNQAEKPWTDALAIRGDRVVAAGTAEEIQKLTGPKTTVVDAGGRVTVPGFNDAHTHPGTTLEGVQLEVGGGPLPDPTFKEIRKLVAEAAVKSPAGTWIFGQIGGTIIDDAEATRFGLDEVSKDHPVLLRSWTGHGTFFNTAAMKALGLSETEPDPAGGFYTRLRKGGSDRTLSGFAHEYAEYRIDRTLHEKATDAAIVEAFRAFADELASLGITSTQAVMNKHDAERVAKALQGTALPVRMRLVRFPLIDPANWEPPADTAPAAAASMLSVWGTKWIFDGTPIERLALFRQPYVDRAGWRGQPNFRDTSMRPMLYKSLERREQVLLHAAGDGAIDQVFSAMIAAGSPLRWQSRRLRIEHGDGLIGELVDVARKLGIVVVQNPTHFGIDATIKSRLGAARAATLQPMKSIAAAGIPVAIGSDGPLNPGVNVMFATTHPGNPREALSREEAVRAYTWGSAYAEFAEQEKGTIAPGMLADVAVLSQDIFAVPPDALPETKAVVTIVGGRVVYDKR